MNDDYPFIRDYCHLVGSSRQYLTAELERARKANAPPDVWASNKSGFPKRWYRVSELPPHAPYRHSLEKRGLYPAK